MLMLIYNVIINIKVVLMAIFVDILNLTLYFILKLVWCFDLIWRSQ